MQYNFEKEIPGVIETPVNNYAKLHQSSTQTHVTMNIGSIA